MVKVPVVSTEDGKMYVELALDNPLCVVCGFFVCFKPFAINVLAPWKTASVN